MAKKAKKAKEERKLSKDEFYSKFDKMIGEAEGHTSTWSQKQDQAELWVANLVGSADHAVPRAQRFAVALAR
jgi:hypothetical protein